MHRSPALKYSIYILVYMLIFQNIMFICFVSLSEQTAINPINSINTQIFIIKKRNVFYDIGTVPWNTLASKTNKKNTFLTAALYL
jgi:hypothetical protein